jgi:hypothetical protein
MSLQNVSQVISRPAPGRRSARDEAMKSLPEARRHADDLLVYDNTPNGKGHRLVVRFIAGELVKTKNTSPNWLKNVFGRELRDEIKQKEKLPRER